VAEMAKQEHDLWVQYQLDCGWRLGPRDNEKRTRPDLLPRRELDGLKEPNGLELKDTTIDYIRDAPDLLVRFGMAVKGPRKAIGCRQRVRIQRQEVSGGEPPVPATTGTRCCLPSRRRRKPH
jgi:hypothetical protein